MGDLSTNFSRWELDCPCGCGAYYHQPRLVEGLQALRDYLGVAVTISPRGGGVRCPDYNHEAGGAEDSQHLYGRAADIVVEGIHHDAVADLAERLVQFRLGGIGRYDTFTHVDVRQGPARWDYRTPEARAAAHMRRVGDYVEGRRENL